LQFTKSAGSRFHSVIDLGKKENLKTSLDTFGILYLKAWLLPPHSCRLLQIYSIAAPKKLNTTTIKTNKQTNKATRVENLPKILPKKKKKIPGV